MERKMPKKRLLHCGMIVVLTMFLTFFLTYQNGFLLDRMLTYLLIDAVFLAVLFYMLERSRLQRELGVSRTNHYGGIAIFYGICCVVTAVCCFLPAFTCPAAALALFCCMIASSEIAFTISLFLCVLLCTAAEGALLELAAYSILALIGTQMAKTVRDKELRLWGCMIFVSTSICIPSLFHYLAAQKGSLQIFLWNGGFGILAALLYCMLEDRIYAKREQEEIKAYEQIIDDKYPLVTEIKNYSKTEYLHALKAASIARKCAVEVGADGMVATVAGFYYRIGVMEGEPYVENGVRLAEEQCFPEEVIQILYEYNGAKQLPSTRESAIVHMVDVCLNRMEMLNEHTMSSSWNQDLVIYQTLNEMSESGIYDESGLSMNQFLRVRELLTHEEL